MKRTHQFSLCLAVLVLMVLGAAMPSAGAAGNSRFTTGTAGPSPSASQVTPPAPLPPFDPKTQFVDGWTCDIFGPAEVQGYRVVCPGGSFLDFFMSDGFIPGDHWELKGKNWDLFPNSAVTTSPGPVIQYGVPGRVYTYGANPLDAYIECSYIHGVNIFPASGFIIFASDAGNCTVTPDPVRSRINRTP